MSLREEQSAFARDLVRLLTYASGKGYEYTIGEVERPVEMQRLHIAAGRSTTMNSMHIKKCAADVYFFLDGQLTYNIEDLGRFWEELDPKNKWGGNWKSFKDKFHFQRTV
jgi:peptidoglycan L-alanyl-D-glutamate endopeptidase CwlK